MKWTAHTAEVVRRWLIAVVIVLLATAAVSLAFGAVGKPPASLTAHSCYTCHSDQEALAGPALAEIAAHYRGRGDAVSKIAAEIRAGIRGGGPWHMPPHPEVSPQEARAMARYILSLDPKNAAPQEVNRH